MKAVNILQVLSYPYMPWKGGPITYVCPFNHALEKAKGKSPTGIPKKKVRSYLGIQGMSLK